MRLAALRELMEPSHESGDPLAGTPYRTLGRLGRGGMGEVLEAEHQALRKRVVVKLLHRELASDPRFADRLRVEAQALAAVSSPNVVSVSDLGQTPAGRPYLVMERLHGHTLREELKERGWIPVDEAIGITCQVLAGLAAAHRIGIIHRDVKLDNIFLCAPAEGGAPVVKVLDFGIVKLLHPGESSAPFHAPKYPTEEGVLVGSPRTVSPEQARFQTVDARTDVYAVGLLLYTLIVGEEPFAHAADILELLNAHIWETPAPPSQAAKQHVPLELDRAILQALAKRPEHRFQSAEFFAEELARIASVLVEGARSLRQTDDIGAVAPPSAVRAATEATARGTLVMRPPSPGPPSRPVGGPLGPSAWFAPLEDATLVAHGLSNLAPVPLGRGTARTFALLVLASTTAFSLLAALLFRYLGGR